MDVVICVELKDVYFLNRNIYYIERNIAPNNIYIVTDRRNFRYLYGNTSIVRLIDENELIDGITFDEIKTIMNKHISAKNYGWYFQQFLKLGFALSAYAKDEYLVWDADTVPLNKLNFIDDNGNYLILAKKEHHQPYFNTIDKLFKAKQKADYSFIAEHMVFNTEIVREMINKIEENSQKRYKWVEQCIAAITDNTLQGFSEFETYGTYCLNYHPNRLIIRYLNTFRWGSLIYGVCVSEHELNKLSFDLDTVSFEISVLPISFLRRLHQICLYYIFRLISKTRIKIKAFPL